MNAAPRKEDRFDWNDQAVATLRRWWGRGETAAAIAREIGATRCSVIGKAHRLKLERRPKPVKACPANQGKGSGSGMKEWWDNFWTADRDAVVSRGYSTATAMPVAIIANTVGCSLSSVMRRAKELGHKHPGLAGVGMAKAKCDSQAKGIILRHPSVAPDSRTVALADLKPGECVFPVTPHDARRHLFCAAPKGNGPYCPFHTSITRIALEKKDAA